MVYEELRRIVLEIDMPELNRYTNLRKRITDEMTNLLAENLKPANMMVSNLIQI